jgi:hypothetical protein
VPAAQLVQSVAPVAAVNLPAAQDVHATPEPVEGEILPTAHATQLVEATAAVVVR